jgi:glycosyltransferase involved in cell wall biosynthesis
VGKLTVLTLVPNAGDRLARCLESVSWADDLFCVVDAKTNDGSESVAREFTNHIAVRPYENAADQRNWAIPQIETEWTLVLDADEWVPEPLAGEIRRIVAADGGADGYQIRRRSYFFEKLIRYCGWQRDYNLRLFRTAKGRYLEQRVHSRVEVHGAVNVIEEPMYHDTYRDFEEYFATMQRFTTWGAADLFEKGKRARLSDLTLRPVVKFLKMYGLHRGFLDGYAGAVLCGLGAFSVFLKYAKLWAMARTDTPGLGT